MKNVLVEKYKRSLDKLNILFESTQSEIEYLKNNHKWLSDKKRNVYYMPLNESKTIFFSEGDIAIVSNILLEDFWDDVKSVANDVADTVTKGAEEIGKGVKLVAGEISDTFWNVVNGIAIFGENFKSIREAFSSMTSGDWESIKVILGVTAFLEIFCMVGAVISSVGVLTGGVGSIIGTIIKMLPAFAGGFLIGNGLKLLLTKPEKKEEIKTTADNGEEEMLEEELDTKNIKNEVDKKIEMVSGGSFVEGVSKIASDEAMNSSFVHIITGVVTLILNGKHHITQTFIEKAQSIITNYSQKIQDILKTNESKIYNSAILKSFNTNNVSSPIIHYSTGMLATLLGKRLAIVKKDLKYIPNENPKNNKSEIANLFSGTFSDWMKNKSDSFKKQVDTFVAGTLKVTDGFGILSTIKDTLMNLINKVVEFITKQIGNIINKLVESLPMLKMFWGLIVFYFGVFTAYKVEIVDLLTSLEIKPDSNDLENRIKTFLETKNSKAVKENKSYVVTFEEYVTLI